MLPLCSVGRRGSLKGWYDAVGIWRAWGGEVRGRALECGHYLAEEALEETDSELRAIFGAGWPDRSLSL